MMTWIQTIFDVSAYSRQLDRYRANLVYGTLALMFLAYGLSALLVRDWGIDTVAGHSTMLEVAFANPFHIASFMFYTLIVGVGLGFWWTRQGNLDYARWTPIVVWYFIGIVLSVFVARSPSYPAVCTVILALLGGLLFGGQGIIGTSVAGILTVVARGLTYPDYVMVNGEPSMVTTILAMVSGSILVYLYLRFSIAARQEIVSDIQEDTSITGTVLRNIAQQVALRVSPQKLMSEIATRMQTAFPEIHHVQVFLLSDDGAQAELAASTGELGRIMMDKGYSIPLGSNSIISRVIETGGSVIEGREGKSGRNERLPDSSVQIVLPLRIGMKVLGALDVQSKDEAAFDEFTAISTFQALADSLALAIDNVTQYQRAESRLRENERLVGEARTALREVERLNDRLTGSAWTDYLRNTRKALGAMVDFDSEITLDEFVETPTLRDAMQVNQLVEEHADGMQVIAVPLRVRGRVVGAMEFEMEEGDKFSPEDYELLQEVSERFGMAVDNARLVDESQRLAQREAIVSQITSRLQATNDVENMLGEAARSLRDTLGTRRVSIRLGSPDEKRR